MNKVITIGRTFTPPPAAMADHAQAVYAEQSKVIWELAEKSDCVIVGRCADYVLRKLSPFRLFIYADQIWGEKKNYDLCINTSGIEIIKIIDAIECFLPFK